MKQRYFLTDDLAVINKGDRVFIFNTKQIKPLFFSRNSKFHSVWKTIEKNKKRPLRKDILSPGALKILKDNFIIHRGKKESVHSFSEAPGADRKGSEYSLYLNLVQYCNQRCIYCYNGESSYRKEQKPTMDETTAKKAIAAALKSTGPHDKLRIIFYGGEPLLNWALARKVIKYCRGLKKKGLGGKTILFQIFTNLIIFPADLVKVAKKNNILFVVGIDGTQFIHDKTRPLANGGSSFQITAKNVKKLANAGIKVILRASITKYNQEKLSEIVRLHKKLGASSSLLAVLSIFDSDGRILSQEMRPSPKRIAAGLKELYRSKIWEPERIHLFNLYLSRLKDGPEALRCNASQGQKLTVDTNGNVFLCFLLLGRDDFKLGSVLDKKNSLGKINKNIEKIKKEHDLPKCKKCAFRFYCNVNDCLSKKIFAQDYPVIKNYNQRISCAVTRTVMGEIIFSQARDIGDF